MAHLRPVEDRILDPVLRPEGRRFLVGTKRGEQATEPTPRAR